MRIAFTESFRRDYAGLPERIKRAIDEQLARLLEDRRHPSLHTKKMKGTSKILELRVTGGYRITFEIHDDIYLLRRVGTHDVLRRP